MKTTLIYNPQAGALRHHPWRLQKAIEVLLQQDPDLDVRPTTAPSTAGLLARHSVETGAERILVAGGDGTLNEVLGGVVGLDVELGLLPAGTANVFATETRLGSNLLQAARRLVHCEASPMAVGRISTERGMRHFLCMAGVGLDADIVRWVSPGVKRALGKASYWLAGIAQVGRRLPEFEVCLDGKKARCSFALISRVKNYGGDLEIARHADVRDNRFAVVLFEGTNTLRYLKYFAGVVLDRLPRMKGVTMAHASVVEVGGGAPLQVDGEDAGDSPARIEVLPGAVRMLLPRGT